jgi:hypothetical protein
MYGAEGLAQTLECLPSKLKGLSKNFSATKKKILHMCAFFVLFFNVPILREVSQFYFFKNSYNPSYSGGRD